VCSEIHADIHVNVLVIESYSSKFICEVYDLVNPHYLLLYINVITSRFSCLSVRVCVCVCVCVRACVLLVQPERLRMLFSCDVPCIHIIIVCVFVSLLTSWI